MSTARVVPLVTILVSALVAVNFAQRLAGQGGGMLPIAGLFVAAFALGLSAAAWTTDRKAPASTATL